MSRNDKMSKPLIANWTPHIAQFPRMVIGCDKWSVALCAPPPVLTSGHCGPGRCIWPIVTSVWPVRVVSPQSLVSWEHRAVSQPIAARRHILRALYLLLHSTLTMCIIVHTLGLHSLIKWIKHCATIWISWWTNDQMLHIVHNTRQLSSPVMRCYQQRVSRVTSLLSGAQPGLLGVQRAAVLQTAGNIIMTPPRETLFTGPHQIESKSSRYHPCSLISGPSD